MVLYPPSDNETRQKLQWLVQRDCTCQSKVLSIDPEDHCGSCTYKLIMCNKYRLYTSTLDPSPMRQGHPYDLLELVHAALHELTDIRINMEKPDEIMSRVLTVALGLKVGVDDWLGIERPEFIEVDIPSIELVTMDPSKTKN